MAWDLVCPPRVEFLFLSDPWNSCNQYLLPFKVRRCRGSASHCQAPRMGSLMCYSKLSLLWNNFHGIISLWFVGCPPRMYEIWFCYGCTPPTISLWLLASTMFECWVSFLVASNVFCWWLLSSCAFGVYERSDITSFYFAILPPAIYETTPWGCFLEFQNQSAQSHSKPSLQM